MAAAKTKTKKRPRKIAATSKTVKKVARKKTTAKATPKKRATTKAATPRAPRGEFDEHGFRVGTDSSIIAAELLEGGYDRDDINDRVAELLPETTTRSGNDKQVPSLVSGILKRLQERGYTVESSWQLVPPTSKKASSNGAAKKRTTKKTAKKVAKKKTASRR